MTLNATVFGLNYVLQVSDRRLSVVRNGILTKKDQSNKAIVLCCLNGRLTITYTGLGEINGLGVDEWLLEELEDHYAAEHRCEDIPALIANLADKRLNEILRTWKIPHAFTLAGWSSNDKESIRVGWMVQNTTTQGQGFFVSPASPHRTKMGGIIFTGFVKAISVEQRRRMFQLLRRGVSASLLETELVTLIRESASKRGVYQVGKSCTSVGLSSDGTCIAHYYPEKASSQAYCPNVLWSSNGQSYAVKGMRYLRPGQHVVRFGPRTNPALVVEPPFLDRYQSQEDLRVGIHVRLGKSKSGLNPSGDGDIMSIKRITAEELVFERNA